MGKVSFALSTYASGVFVDYLLVCFGNVFSTAFSKLAEVNFVGQVHAQAIRLVPELYQQIVGHAHVCAENDILIAFPAF